VKARQRRRRGPDRGSPKFNNICVISYTPSPDRRQDRTRLRPDYRVSTGPRRQRPELRPRDDRRATKRGPGYTLVDAYRTFTVGIIYPYTNRRCTVHCKPKAGGHRAAGNHPSSRRRAARSSTSGAPSALITALCSGRLRARFSLGFSLGFSPRVSLDAVRARGFTCNMPRMHAQARARVWRQHACKTHASAHHSALLAQEGASLWGRRSGPPVPLEVGQLLLILDLCERLLLWRLGGCDRGLVLLRRAERL
jgi:hypothetical protein